MTKKIDYTQQMDWVKDDPALLTWQIKTIAHDMKKLEYFCVFILVVSFLTILLSIIIYFIPNSNSMLALVLAILGGAGICVFSLALFGEVRRKVWLIYRITESGIQCWRWRAYPKALFKGIRFIFICFGILAIIIGLIADAGIMVLAGPVGIAVGLGSFAFSKDYEEAMVNLTLNSFIWCDVLEASYDEEQQVIFIEYNHPLTEKDRQEIREQGYDPDLSVTEGDIYLFLIPQSMEQVIGLVEKWLPPSISLQRTKVTLPAVV